ncbi:MAG: adenylosuccinate lyase, partial [Spirochaetales bacterium]|nr:adenylosuccinate lyase [Spirochaetales bacterium]
EVYSEEEKTQHNIRALVNVMKSKISDELKPYVHLGATSVDILDTAFALRIRDAIRNCILPLMIEVEELLIELCENEAETPQVGRTHGQHAVPITIGFAFAEYAARLGKSIKELSDRSKDLRGKLSGAVGAYNATSMIVKDPEELEKLCLGYLDIKPSEICTQMVEPEYLLRALLEVNIAFGVIANLADDLRNLQRSEISEVREFFSSTQVGSSTMPQKRNPWNSEHVKSLWKAFSPRVQTFFMDQISEHQRDLTNSASSRFAVEYLAGFASAANRMKKILASLYIDNNRLRANLNTAGDLLLAEPAYILLSLGGEPDAHEVIRKITLACENEGISFLEALKKNEKAWSLIRTRFQELRGQNAEDFFADPSSYRGKAAEKARSIANTYKELMKNLKKRNLNDN